MIDSFKQKLLDKSHLIHETFKIIITICAPKRRLSVS